MQRLRFTPTGDLLQREGLRVGEASGWLADMSEIDEVAAGCQDEAGLRIGPANGTWAEKDCEGTMGYEELSRMPLESLLYYVLVGAGRRRCRK